MPRRRIVAAPVTLVKRRLGYFIELSRRVDVVILRRGKPIAVLMGIKRYQRLAAAAARRSGSPPSPKHQGKLAKRRR